MSMLEAAVLAQLDSLPDIEWTHGDDLCDCTFQRIGEWTNPYLDKTLRVRMCCIWAEIYKQYPQFVQEISGYWDENSKEFVTDPQIWNAEDADMPVHLWHRQVANIVGVSPSEARDLVKGRTPPTRVPKGTGIQLYEGEQ